VCWGVGELDQRIDKGNGKRRLVPWYRCACTRVPMRGRASERVCFRVNIRADVRNLQVQAGERVHGWRVALCSEPRIHRSHDISLLSTLRRHAARLAWSRMTFPSSTFAPSTSALASPRRPIKVVRRRARVLLIPLSTAPKPEFLVAHMSRQTAAGLASPRALRRTVREGILHCDIKRVVIFIRLRVLQRALMFYS
jgi:hypothetical protein